MLKGLSTDCEGNAGNAETPTEVAHRLSQVCRRFRAALEESSSLWTWISTEMTDELVQRCLRLSGAQGLNIVMVATSSIYYSDSSKICGRSPSYLLIQHASRWTSFAMRYEFWKGSDLENVRRDSKLPVDFFHSDFITKSGNFLSNLRTVSIECHNDDYLQRGDTSVYYTLLPYWILAEKVHLHLNTLVYRRLQPISHLTIILDIRTHLSGLDRIFFTESLRFVHIIFPAGAKGEFRDGAVFHQRHNFTNIEDIRLEFRYSEPADLTRHQQSTRLLWDGMFFSSAKQLGLVYRFMGKDAFSLPTITLYRVQDATLAILFAKKSDWTSLSSVSVEVSFYVPTGTKRATPSKALDGPLSSSPVPPMRSEYFTQLDVRSYLG